MGDSRTWNCIYPGPRGEKGHEQGERQELEGNALHQQNSVPAEYQCQGCLRVSSSNQVSICRSDWEQEASGQAKRGERANLRTHSVPRNRQVVRIREVFM